MAREYFGARKVLVEESLLTAIPLTINHAFGTTEQLLTNPDPVNNKAIILHCDLHDFRIRPGKYVGFPFVQADVSVANNTITEAAHGLVDGDGPYQLANGGGLPAPIVVDTNYYVIEAGVNAISLATSYENAIAGVAIDITTTGAAVTHGFGNADSGWAGFVDPPANVTDGYGSIKISAGQTMKLSAPTHLTVIGWGAAPALTYYWV